MNLTLIVAALCKRQAQTLHKPEPEAPTTWRGRLARSLFLLTTLTLPAHAQLDTLANGMSDVWERHYNRDNPGQLFDPENPAHHPEADPDGDGWTNLQESIAGTDPFSGNPPEGMVAIQITHLRDQEEAPSLEYPDGRLINLAIISWDTLPGKQYILKASPDLSGESWITIDAPYAGDGSPAAISVTLTDTEGEAPMRLFWRVNVDDPHTDTDGDGLTDYEEYLLGSNPYAADTSGDGVPDGWLVVHGFNPNDHHESILFHGSNSSVVGAFSMGVQAHPNATLEDFDGDGVPNHLDAVPDDPEIKWLRTPEVHYALMELPAVPTGGTGDLYIQSLSENGHVLVKDKEYGPDNYYVGRLGDTSWSDPLKLKMNGLDMAKQFSEAICVDSMGRVYGRAYVYKERNNRNIFHWTPLVWQSLDHEAEPIGNDPTLKPTMIQGGVYTPADFDEAPVYLTAEGVLLLAPDDTLLYQPRSAIYPTDDEEDGPPQMKYGDQDIGYIENNYEYWSLSWEDVQGICYSNVSKPGAGGIAAATLEANGETTLYFIENGQRELVSTLENGYWPLGIARMSDQSGVEGGGTFAVIGYPDEGEQGLWIRSDDGWSQPSNHNVSGYAINREGVMLLNGNKLWRNGKTHSLHDLCPNLDHYASYSVLDLKDNGQIAVSVTEQSGKVKPMILVPIDFSVFPPEPTEDELTAAGDDNWEVETFQIPADDPEFWIQANVMVPGVDEDGENAWVPAANGTVITWEIVSDESDSGAVLSDQTTETENGHTAVKLTTSTEPGARFKVRGHITTLKLPVENSENPTVYANTDGFIEVKTQLFEVVPGNVTSISLTASASTMPADEASEIEIEAVFTDAAGNPAARGTDVNWRVSGGGQIQDRDHLIAEQDGVATATLVSGSIVGTQTVTVEADGVVSEIQINNTPVQLVSLTPSASSLDIATGQSTTITLQTSGIADGAPVSWSTTKGTILSYEGVVENNSAQAVLVADAGTIGDAGVIATVGDAVAHCEVLFTSSSEASIEVSQPVIVHDELSDGSSPVPALAGNPENIPYFAESLITIRAPGHPGAWATIDFKGSSGTYGLRHSFDAATDNLSPSSIEGYPATLAGNAEIDETWHLVREGTGSISLPDATSTATIPHHDSLSLANGSTMRFAIYPVETVGQLIAKAGEYQIAFLPDGRLEFTLGAGVNVASVASAMPLAPGNWSDVTLSIQSGHLWMNVGGATTAIPLPASLPVSTGNLVIGGMIGHFDALRFTHAQNGFQGISISASGLNGLNQVQLDANGEATITVTAQALGGGPPEGSIGQNVDVEITLASQSVVAKNAITVTDKGTAVLIRAIAGQSAVIGTDTSNLDRAEMAHNFLRRGIRDADRVGALPADMGGDAAARGECGYLIAIWMEETVDDAGIVHPLMHVSAQNLPEEVAEVLNWMLAEMMVSAGHRPDSESFKDYILRNHKELLMALQALSAGDEDAFLAIASIADGEEAFGDLSVAGNQVGDGFMTRIAKTAASEINNGYELVRAAFNRRNSRIKMASLSQGGANFNHAIRGPIIDLMQAGDAGMEAVLRDLSQALYTAEILTSQEVAAVGALYGFLREGNEIAQEIAHPELFAKAIPTLLDMLIGAARGDEASLDALKDIGSAIVMGPINEIPQASEAWDSGQHFNAGSHYAAAAVGGVLIADTFKRSLQRGAYRCVAHGKHLTRLVGLRGEALAMARFRAKGYTDIVPIQNSSGHGIDLIMRDRNGGIVAVEVKSHLLMQRPKVNTDMKKFVETRLFGARSKSGHWNNVDEATRLHAVRYLEEILLLKRPVRGIVVNLDYALTQYPRVRYYEWSKGLGAEIFTNNF